MGRGVLHPVFLLSVVRCRVSLRLVVAADVADETGVQHSREMGRADGDPRCHSDYREHDPGLLGVPDEAAGIFLCAHAGCRCGYGPALGLPQDLRHRTADF